MERGCIHFSQTYQDTSLTISFTENKHQLVTSQVRPPCVKCAQKKENISKSLRIEVVRIFPPPFKEKRKFHMYCLQITVYTTGGEFLLF